MSTVSDEERAAFEAGLRRIYRDKLEPLDQVGIERLFGKPDQDGEDEEDDADAE